MSHAASPPLTRPGLRHRGYAACAAIAGTALLTTLALAGSVNPLQGIGAADDPQTPADALDAGVRAQLRADIVSPGGVDQIGGRLSDSSRLVGALPGGKKVYVVPTTMGRLCVVLAGSAESCGSPLTQPEPVTFTTVFRHAGEPTYAYGIARDGVAAVSFVVSGEHVTVPVQHNLFVYETAPGDSPRSFGDVKATFNDGTVEPVG